MNIKSIIKRQLIRITKPCVIFESYPNFSDNTKQVFDEFVRRGLGKKYHLYWYVDKDTAAFFYSGVPVFWNTNRVSMFKNRIRNFIYYNNIKAVILCNRHIVPEPFSHCYKSFYLTHGTTLKDVSSYYKIPNEVDYCISPSEYLREAFSISFDYDYNRIIPLGFPRNDVLSKEKINIKRILNTNCNKIIVWYPTYKQHNGGYKTGCKHALPIIHNRKNAEILNQYLNRKNVLIVLKPHFAQDLSYINDIKMSNIRFINDRFYSEHNIIPYQFLGSCDALITDYSSVYSDFLLCNKPIGLIWEDIEDYKKNPGLVPMYEDITCGTNKIYNLNDLMDFVKDVALEKDKFESERNNLRDKLNISTDGHNTERVVDFIIKKAKLKF